MEDNRQFIASIMPNREYEISGTPPRNSSISNDDCYKEAAVWASEFLGLENLVLSQSNCFASSTWLPNLNELLLSKTGIVNLPASIKRFVRLRLLYLEQCEQLQEIPELPQSIKKVYARGCISLESFPQVSKKFQFDTSDDSLDKLNWLDLSACHKMLKKLRNPVLSPSLHPDLQLGPIYVGEEIPTSRFRLLEDYVLDGIADHRSGFPTWFSRRYGNRCRINVILQECLEEAITITLCAVIVIARPLVELCVSASVIREGRSPRRVEGTTVCIEVEIASCEVHRVHEHKERVEARKRKNENKERVEAQKMKRENKETGREKDDVLQMDVSNAEPENKERARTKDAPDFQGIRVLEKGQWNLGKPYRQFFDADLL
ncbi:hypothetical protein CJ030_MR5G001750 [Morella rubra]|uniref:TMV resistance protein N n=1 Tax=Morella rubra TaxID=262757 RepID=A0A6A1VK12_9ROSI|nr:hypothetical protein CJ030_MR5G001750 [Morella rubra]